MLPAVHYVKGRKATELVEGLCGVEDADDILVRSIHTSQFENERSSGGAKILLVSGQLPVHVKKSRQSRHKCIGADNHNHPR